jgi:hypothetical protein
VDFFFIFQPSKICVSPTGVISSISPPRWRLSSCRRRHSAVPCHAYFPWSQDELVVSASSFSNASSRRLPSRRPPSPYRPQGRSWDLRGPGKIIYEGPSTYLYRFIGIYIILYKHIVEVNKYMNINYVYRELHFNINYALSRSCNIHDRTSTIVTSENWETEHMEDIRLAGAANFAQLSRHGTRQTERSRRRRVWLCFWILILIAIAASRDYGVRMSMMRSQAAHGLFGPKFCVGQVMTR